MTIFVFLLGAAVTGASPALPPPVEMIATKWTLENAKDGKTAARKRTAGSSRKSASKASLKPRLFGGATVNNRSGQNKRAQVGVAIPF